MARLFDFSESTKNQAFFRQWNLCAHCGRSLINLIDHAHHVVPNQMGKAGHKGDFWIREVDNCVMLCEHCHHRVHEDGRYRTGAVASPADYPFSHGRNAEKEHRHWASKMEKRFTAKSNALLKKGMT